jgi:heme-degrading monooxygenase HmoA
MIVEIAKLSIKPGSEVAFEAGVKEAQALFKRAKGCKSMVLRRSVENPSQYSLFVTWNNINDHIVDFKDSEDIKEWRRLVGSLFASPPEIEHFETAQEGFTQ